MRRTWEVEGIVNNSAAGQKTVILPTLLDYLHLRLEAQTATRSTLTQLIQRVNGENFRVITGAQQDDMNQEQLMSAMSVDHILAIPFELMRCINLVQRYSVSLNTLSASPDNGDQITSMQFLWTDSTTDTWRAFADVDDATVGGPGALLRYQEGTAPLQASSTFSASLRNFIDSGTPQMRFLMRMFQLLASGTFENGDVQFIYGANKAEALHRTVFGNVRDLTDPGYRAVPTTYAASSGGLVIDFVETGISEPFDTMAPATPNQIQANVPGLAVIDGTQYAPYGGVDFRFSPTASTTTTSLTEWGGSL